MRVGLGVYDALAGKRGIGDTHWLSRAATIAELPGVKADGFVWRGGLLGRAIRRRASSDRSNAHRRAFGSSGSQLRRGR